GNHRCQLTSNVGNNSNIAVLELHQHLVINCSTTQKSSSNLTFEWNKDRPYRVKKIGVPSINISDVAWNDAGRYECIIKQNRSLESCDFTVIVKSFVLEKCAEFKNKTRKIDVTISLGSSTSLLCEVMYFTIFPSFFKFLKIVNQKFVNIGGNDTKNILKKENKISNIVKLINYTIVNASRNDTGTYKCDFINKNVFFCPKNLYKVFNVKVIASSPLNKKKLNLVVVIAVSVTGALSGVALILYVYHLRRKSKARLYDICPDDQPELRWDVFVSYSSHDFVWVNELCQMLEQPPFNLIVCLHQRDWELGRSLQDNMVDSIYCSHKTLIIVSKHYLQSEYCMQELQLAMHSEIASEHVRKDRIVLIKIDDVSTQRLPRVLRQKSYLDSSDPEHAKHFKTNLLRVLPRRELMEEGPFEEEDKQISDDASGSSREMRLHELPVV
ncbi:neural cell adhesion molecule L1-like, partial [Paramuricea clavata]